MEGSISFPGELIDKRNQKIKIQLSKSGYILSKELLDLIKKIDKLQDKLCTLEEIQEAYSSQQEDPEIQNLVNQIARIIILQKSMQPDQVFED